MKKDYTNPAVCRSVYEEISSLMREAERSIILRESERFYSLKTHWFLMENQWKIMLPLKKDKWSDSFKKLTIKDDSLSWAEHGASFFNKERQPLFGLEADQICFGYAVVAGTLSKASFLISRGFNELTTPAFCEEMVIDLYAEENRELADYYIGYSVGESDLLGYKKLQVNPLEAFVERMEQEEHDTRMTKYYVDVYEDLIGEDLKHLPRPLAKFARDNYFYVPEQTGEPQELLNIQELEEKGTVGGKKPIEIIRTMNPGVFIPTGEELSKMIKNKETK